MIPVGKELSRFAFRTGFADLPEDVRHEGARAFVNWIGCCAGGCREESVEIALQTNLEFASGDEAIVVGRSERLDMLNAAFVNGMSSSVHSYNDTHFETVAHPTSSVAAALMGIIGRHAVSGRDLVAALVLGIELQCRVGRMLASSPAECHLGLSMVGMVGGIGAAVASAKVLGLDEAQILTAIGIAANQAAGLREAHATMSSHFTPGMAARSGIYAAILAARGFTCSPTMLEGPKGFGASFSRNPNHEAAVDGLGSSYEIRKLAYKPYPCGFVIHPVIDACLEIVRNGVPNAEAIDRVEIDGNPVLLALTDRPAPAGRRQALVSFQHWTAAALVRGKAGLEEGSEATVADPLIARLRSKVSANADKKYGREAAAIRITLNDGRILESEISDCLGSEKRPMTDAELDEKFRGQARLVWSADAADAISRWGWNIAEVADVGAEADLLRLEPGSRSGHAS